MSHFFILVFIFAFSAFVGVMATAGSVKPSAPWISGAITFILCAVLMGVLL